MFILVFHAVAEMQDFSLLCLTQSLCWITCLCLYLMTGTAISKPLVLQNLVIKCSLIVDFQRLKASPLNIDLHIFGTSKGILLDSHSLPMWKTALSDPEWDFWLLGFCFFSFLCLWLTPNLENLITEVGPLDFLKSQSVPKDRVHSPLRCQQSLTSKYRVCWSQLRMSFTFRDSSQHKRMLPDAARYMWPANMHKCAWPYKLSGKC